MANPVMRVLILVLTVLVLVSSNPLATEILQTAFQMPDGDIIAEIPHQIDQDGVPTYESENNLLDLWSKIDAALRFLEHQPTNKAVRDKIQEYFHRDKTLEGAKILPLIRHHFIRFGKRSVSS